MSDNSFALEEDSKSKGILWGFGTLVGIVLVVMLILGEWWSREPAQFNVQDEAIERMNVTHTDQMPIGYVYANTLAHIADVILFKAGGYLSNDVAPPGLFCDNIQNFEYGALVMLRDGTTALRNHFARDQSQSAEDPDLAKAEPYFITSAIPGPCRPPSRNILKVSRRYMAICRGCKIRLRPRERPNSTPAPTTCGNTPRS